jgi:hypothetical protein
MLQGRVQRLRIQACPTRRRCCVLAALAVQGQLKDWVPWEMYRLMMFRFGVGAVAEGSGGQGEGEEGLGWRK